MWYEIMVYIHVVRAVVGLHGVIRAVSLAGHVLVLKGIFLIWLLAADDGKY